MPRTATGRHRARSTTPESRTFTNTGRRVSPGYTGSHRGTETADSAPSPPQRSQRQSRPVRDYSPVRAGDKATSGIGLLEAEFLGSILLLILLLFADLNRSYSDKIMSTMKRGTLICLLFFILSLISGVGPNMAKIAKALGGMVFVGILVTSPVLDLIGNMDKFFKADWSGTSEHGTDVGSTSQTSDTGSGTTGGTAGPLSAAEGAISRINDIINSFGFGLIK